MRTVLNSNRISCLKIRRIAYLSILFVAFVSVTADESIRHRHRKNRSSDENDEGSGHSRYFTTEEGRTGKIYEGSGHTTPRTYFTTEESRIRKNRFCPAEPFDNDTLSTVHWNVAEAGQIAITNMPCLQPNGLPLTRRCRWNEQLSLSYWEKMESNSIECLTRTQEKLITNTLAELEEEAFVLNRTRPADATKRLKRLLKTADYKLIPTDVHFACRIVQQAVARGRTADLCLDLISMYNRLMGADKEILRASTMFNSTNNLVANFEMCIDSTFGERNSSVIAAEDQIEGVNMADLGVRAHLAENLSVFYIEPDVANVSGIALYDQPGDPLAPGILREAFGDFYYRFVYSNETLADLLNVSGLEMASYIPIELWKNLSMHLPPPALLIVKVYANDAFFMEARLNTTRRVFSKIVSLTIPGVTGSFDGIIPMIFHNQKLESSANHTGTGCGYWNYDTWVSDGIEVIQEISSDSKLIACGSHHMTQFAYLIGGDYRYNDFSDNVIITKRHQRALNIITLVGCTLSILGVSGIFITSIVFKSWRSKASSKVLLHMCVAIMFQMVLFCFVNTNDLTEYLMENKNYIGCIAVGSLLQYSVLVQFTWMLIIAFLQFQRYVQVFGSRPKRFILKSSIFGWGAPIIPPAILIASDRSSYIPFQDRDSSVMCYPSGNGLNFGVILPISLIIAANLVIFGMVIWSIRHTMQASTKQSQRKKILQQIRLMVLMFFLFGFSWIFGLLAAMDAGLVFSYLFCLSATLQGFVLFVYFVILDPATRKLWYQLYSHSEEKVNKSETTGLASNSSH